VTVSLLATTVLLSRRGWRRLVPRGTITWLFLMGLISIGINLLSFGALKWTTATNAAMLFRLDLLFVLLIGAALGLERIGFWQLLLMPVLLVGLALAVEIQRFTFSGHIVGDLMVLVAAFGLAGNAFIIRHILRTMDEVAISFYNHATSTLGFVGLALVSREIERSGPLLREPRAWMWIAALGLSAAVSLPLYYVALGRMAVWKLRTFMLTAPLLVAVVEWPLFGFHLHPLQMLGEAIILLGLLVLIVLDSHAPRRGIEEPLEEPLVALVPAAPEVCSGQSAQERR